MFITKKTIRSVLLQYRRLLDKETFHRKNTQLCHQLKRLIESKRPQSIHLFLPIAKNNEPDLTVLLPWIWQNDIQVLVPKTDLKKRTMEHVGYVEGDRLRENKQGIPEPEQGTPAVITSIELILTPLLAADKKGYRIGYGGGFYDQLLAKTTALIAGVSLSSPLDAIIQKDDWDVPLNYLVTPNKTYIL